MAKGGGGGGGEGKREGNALKTAVVVTGGLVLAWLTVETAFKPLLDRLRAAISRSSDPSRDPDDEAAPAPAPAEASSEPSAPPLATEEGEKKAKEKGVELEKDGEATEAKAE